MDLAILYPVAGMSSRFGGKMKWLIKVGSRGESLIEYSVNQAIKAGFNKIIFIVGVKTASYFKDIFGDKYKGVDVFYAFQDFNTTLRDGPWGTVDALCSGLSLIDCPTVFCNGDDIYGEETFKILADHFKNGGLEDTEQKQTGFSSVLQSPKQVFEGLCDVTVGYKLGNVLPDEGSVHRGHFKFEGDYVKDLNEVFNVEKKNLIEKGLGEDSLISMNIFGFLPETVGKLNEILIKFKEDNSGSRDAECLLPNEVGMLVRNGLRMKIYPTSCKWYGVTNPEDEAIVREALIRERVLDRY